MTDQERLRETVIAELARRRALAEDEACLAEEAEALGDPEGQEPPDG
jgi:hypothetical protein